jgi:hypothetical protein
MATCLPGHDTTRSRQKSPRARHILMHPASLLTTMSPLYAMSETGLACPSFRPCAARRPSFARMLLGSLPAGSAASSKACASSGVSAVTSCSQLARCVPAPFVRRRSIRMCTAAVHRRASPCDVLSPLQAACRECGALHSRESYIASGPAGARQARDLVGGGTTYRAKTRQRRPQPHTAYCASPGRSTQARWSRLEQPELTSQTAIPP